MVQLILLTDDGWSKHFFLKSQFQPISYLEPHAAVSSWHSALVSVLVLVSVVELEFVLLMQRTLFGTVPPR